MKRVLLLALMSYASSTSCMSRRAQVLVFSSGCAGLVGHCGYMLANGYKPTLVDKQEVLLTPLGAMPAVHWALVKKGSVLPVDDNK